MNHAKDIIQQVEGRRLEFKEKLPAHSDLAKTVVAFANDAGGNLFIGVVDQTRTIVGIPEEELIITEEKISNIIFDRCYPAILPEIKFLTIDDKHLIQVSIYRGSTPPYYIKEQGKLKGTYIRVGSSNRQADETIIAELERRKRNLSFDAELVLDKQTELLNIESFKRQFEDKTGESFTPQTLKKLGLTQEIQGLNYPTNALILLSDDELRKQMFHFAKVECARFKGVSSDVFIDKKSITSNIVEQAEEAFNFILRHINQSATVKGVYTVSRWEYPIKALREVLRNSIVHRDYSLTGKDVKVAIYDDMIELTSPGLLPPSIDYSAMESRQSDARNKVLAPVFKKIGVIDQWGNGLKLIAEDLSDYPEIELRWKEIGLSFQIQFIKKTIYQSDEDIGGTMIHESSEDDVLNENPPRNGVLNKAARQQNVVLNENPPRNDVLNKAMRQQNVVLNKNSSLDGVLNNKFLCLIKEIPSISAKELAAKTGISMRQSQRIIATLKEDGRLERVGSKKTGHWKIIA